MIAVSMIDRFQKSAGWLISSEVKDPCGEVSASLSAESMRPFRSAGLSGTLGSGGGLGVVGAIDKSSFPC